MKKSTMSIGTVLLMLSFAATAQAPVDASRRTAIVEAVAKAGPAVVSINVIEIQRQRVLDPFSDSFFGLFGFPRGGVPYQERQIESMGSGFFFDSTGHVLTNAHVVANASAITVGLTDGRTLKAEVVGLDEMTDVAVLSIAGRNLPYAALGNSDDLLIGEWAIAIGNPFGTLMDDPQPSVSAGVISANRRRVKPDVAGQQQHLYWDMIQTDAAINPGNSGGPLVNARGEVIGINTFIFSGSGGSVGLGFAIPANRVRRVADEIIRYGRRRNPWAGFTCENIARIRPDILQELRVRSGEGCLVVNLLKRSPAAEAGLEVGDAITGINGQRVREANDIDYAIWSLFVGDAVKLDIDRQGKQMTVQFRIEEISR